MHIRQVYLSPFTHGPRKLQSVLATARNTSKHVDGNGLKQKHAPLWIPRPRVEIISHRLTIYLEAENKASTKTSHSEQ